MEIKPKYDANGLLTEPVKGTQKNFGFVDEASTEEEKSPVYPLMTLVLMV